MAFAVHSVFETNEYDAWHKLFSSYEARRKEHGFLGHHINVSTENPHRISVYFPLVNTDKLADYFASIKGVTDGIDYKSVSVVKLNTVATANLEFGAKRPGVTFRHPVADFDTWFAIFNGPANSVNVKHNVSAHAVSTNLDDRNDVVIYLQAHDIKDLEALIQDPVLQETMRGAGVTGPPAIAFWNELEFKMY